MKSLYRKHFQTILRALGKAVRNVYQDRLVTLAVFGSVGRGTPRPDSDIDLLIIAKNLPHGRMQRMDEFTAVERQLAPILEMMRNHGISTSLSPVFKMCSEAQQGSLLFLDMIDDALLLYDRDRFFSHYLETFRARLTQLGARKLRRGGAWYWVLKEDYAVGEEFEL